MKVDPITASATLVQQDLDLADQAAMCASMLQTLAERWRGRARLGQLGEHPVAEALRFADSLEAAARLLQAASRGDRDRGRGVAVDEGEKRFQLLVDAVKDYAIYMLDADGRVSSWNTGAQRIKGYRADEVLGQHVRLFYTPESAAAAHPEKELEIAARDGRYEEEGWRVRKDGTRFCASVVLTAIRDAAGDLVGFAKVTRDVTERRNNEEELRLAKMELEERVAVRTRELTEANAKLEAAYLDAQHAVRMREEVLAVVSHDLRNPLAAIHMASAMLLLKPSGDPNTRKQAETIHRSASRMDHLLSDLLDMASLQVGRFSIERRSEDPASLVAEVFELHEPLAREKGLHLARDLHLDGVRLSCDRDRVLQVFGNLLGNAIKLCRSGDTIAIRGVVADGRAQFGIADTGPGIPEGELPHVFEPYWSSQRHAKRGTGLGLYISKGIVEAHDGRLWVESCPGEGATFYFTLPLDGDPA